MLTILDIHLLGGLRLRYGNTLVTAVSTPRLQSLLAYLVLSAGVPQLRQHVAFRLWPDTMESHARNNLRQLVHQLRQALPEPNRFLIVDANTICWQRNEEQTVDVWLFERALTAAEAAEQGRDLAGVRRALEKAVSYYQGDLVPACYDEWITTARDDLRGRYQGACQKLVSILEAGREYAGALGVAERMLRLDPLEEDTYALLMRLHALNGDRSAVRRTYQAAIATFGRELGDEPDSALRGLYERLRQPPHVSARTKAGTSERANDASPILVGRLSEWQKLQAAWRRAASGQAHLVLIRGEAGIGKSRLAEELFIWAKQQGLTAAYTRSYGAEGRLSLSPVTEWLRSPVLRTHWAALDGVWLTEVARLLPELLADRKDLTAPQSITEGGGRQRFFEALARAILAAPSPLLLWIDDLQWCDQETLEWLHFLLRFAQPGRLLVLGTARSEELPADHPLSALDRQLQREERITLIDLPPLDAAETAKLAAQVMGRELDDTAAIRLYRETEGNPLFVVETVRSGIGNAPAGEAQPTGSWLAGRLQPLPPRVHEVIAGRLAQLSPPARKIAEVGAAVGSAFTLEVLLQVESENEEGAISALDELWQKRVIREQNPGEFDFTHDKLREVALAEISPPQRRLYHRKIAQVLETLNGQDRDPVSSQIAAQYEQAGMFEQAIPYYQRAGAVAARVYANQDAIGLLTHALSLLAQLPPGPRRDAQELGLQLALAPLHRITRGWTSPEVEHVLNRALLLGDKVGNVAQRAQILYGLQSAQVVAARLEKVATTYAEMYGLFMKLQDEPLPPFADLMYTGAILHMGRLAEAREQFERIVAVRDPRHISDLQDSQGVNYLVHGHAWNAHALWCLGYPDRALMSANAAVEFAREYAQPFNQALAVTYLAMLQEMRADAETFQAHAEEAFVLTREYEAPYYHAWANILVHFARSQTSPKGDGLVLLDDAIGVFRATGARLRLPYYLSLLARTYLAVGELEQGLAVIEQALAESLQNNERWWDAELHRLRGEFMLAQGADPAYVEAAFRRAIEIAQAQGAGSLELRAATSLACLCQAAECDASARQAVTSVYGRFTEGFETPDLQMASSLLAR